MDTVRICFGRAYVSAACNWPHEEALQLRQTRESRHGGRRQGCCRRGTHDCRYFSVGDDDFRSCNQAFPDCTPVTGRIIRLSPTLIALALRSSLAHKSVLSEMPNRAAIALGVSPCSTVYTTIWPESARGSVPSGLRVETRALSWLTCRLKPSSNSPAVADIAALAYWPPKRGMEMPSDGASDATATGADPPKNLNMLSKKPASA